jgi:hypothetical protein
MTRHPLPVSLSMLLLGTLLAAPRAGAQELPVATANEEQAPAAETPAAETDEGQAPAPAKSSGGRIAVTRSDGSTGLTRPPDQKAIRKLVSYIQDGMKRADRADKQRQTKRATQYRTIRK